MAGVLPAGRYFGDVRKVLPGGDFTLLESNYAPDTILPDHTHERAHFCLILSGGYTETLEGKSCRRRTHALVFHPGGRPHSETYHGTGKQFIVEIGDAWLDRLQSYKRVLDDPLYLETGPSVGLAGRLYLEFCRADELTPLAVESLVLGLLVEASRWQLSVREARPPGWLDRVLELLHARFTERLLLVDLAGAVGIHPAHLSRTFRRIQGCTINEYVQRLRIALAMRELATLECPLTEVALKAGFSDQSHFCRVFKRRTGSSPSEFRRNRLHG